MKHSTGFLFNGIDSSSKGVIQASVDSGLFEDNFLASRKINEQKIRGNERPYFLGIEHEPFTFPLTLTFENGFTDEMAREVGRWVSTKYYAPLVFNERPNRIIYCMYQGDTKLIHNGCQQGYVTLNMKCDAPWYYSNVIESQIYDFSSNVLEGSDLTYINNGDLPIKPIIQIEKIGNGDISIINTSNGAEELKFTGLVDGELLKVDCDNEFIESNIGLRYDNHNDVFIELLGFSNNYLKVFGNCKLKLITQQKFSV